MAPVRSPVGRLTNAYVPLAAELKGVIEPRLQEDAGDGAHLLADGVGGDSGSVDEATHAAGSRPSQCEHAPDTGDAAGRSFGVVRTLVRWSRPLSASPTMSERVPPMSTPICTLTPPGCAHRRDRSRTPPPWSRVSPADSFLTLPTSAG
jgi:hypothetical protein